jgi:hypothetical protein
MRPVRLQARTALHSSGQWDLPHAGMYPMCQAVGRMATVGACCNSSMQGANAAAGLSHPACWNRVPPGHIQQEQQQQQH